MLFWLYKHQSFLLNLLFLLLLLLLLLFLLLLTFVFVYKKKKKELYIELLYASEKNAVIM